MVSALKLNLLELHISISNFRKQTAIYYSFYNFKPRE